MLAVTVSSHEKVSTTTDERGLNIVEEIATAHGWDVAITDSERGGARFEFTGVRIDD